MSPSRRAVLRAGAGLAVTGLAGVVGAREADDRDDLRLLGERSVGGTTEVVTQGTDAYVATNDGLAVLDWRRPNAPEVVAERDVPGGGVHDVKVDGDLLAVSSQSASDPADVGTHFYDVSDPADPTRVGTWQELPAGVHNHFLDGDVAYICREFPFDDSALKLVDVGDPSNPTLLSEWRVEDVHPELDRPTNFVHDVYVQDDLAYLAYWDAGTRVLDVSDPTAPDEVASFGAAPDADEPVSGGLDFGPPVSGFEDRILLPPGNAHYVQPSPDGDHVYVGAETFPVPLGVEPTSSTFGGIEVYDTADLDSPEFLTRIAPPTIDDDVSGKNFTSHNFDVTANRLHTSWYSGGVHVYDVTDPASPEHRAGYDPEGSSFWAAVAARGSTVASDIGGGVVVLHDDRGAASTPGFEGSVRNGEGPDRDHHASPG